MTFVGRPWDMFAAELSDTQRGQHSARPSLPCVYCGALTKSVYRVCLDHTDLLDLDPGAPSALDETRVPNCQGAELAAELAPPSALVSSSATYVPPGGANGERFLPGAVALDNSETA